MPTHVNLSIFDDGAHEREEEEGIDCEPNGGRNVGRKIVLLNFWRDARHPKSIYMCSEFDAIIFRRHLVIRLSFEAPKLLRLNSIDCVFALRLCWHDINKQNLVCVQCACPWTIVYIHSYFYQIRMSDWPVVYILVFFCFHSSYAVSIGLIDILSRRCMKIREPIENHQSVVLSILACLGLLTKFADTFPKGLCMIFETLLQGTIKKTDHVSHDLFIFQIRVRRNFCLL